PRVRAGAPVAGRLRLRRRVDPHRADRAGPHPGPDRHRRGHRDRRAGAQGTRDRVRRGAGVLLRPARTGGVDRQASRVRPGPAPRRSGPGVGAPAPTRGPAGAGVGVPGAARGGCYLVPVTQVRERSEEPIRVGVLGARGRMGVEVCKAVDAAPDMELVAMIDQGDWLFNASDAAAEVIVDFTTPDAVMDNLHWCIDQGINAVVGTSGFTEQRLARVRSWL